MTMTKYLADCDQATRYQVYHNTPNDTAAARLLGVSHKIFSTWRKNAGLPKKRDGRTKKMDYSLTLSGGVPFRNVFQGVERQKCEIYLKMIATAGQDRSRPIGDILHAIHVYSQGADIMGLG
ncbi:hypothetical protein ALO_12576 [Acetonema longum DSM 6540]|uniref:Uncharacterized protein n=1 Tax=Acetonema longum DSM 6540 TaxID=1009370 RepID=F7NKA2_9FIRM|nr:hypothetical protein ALO_12576 [Acetonema longum DSM 6540]